ncbi:LpqN/LpqT family lipoprotein [Mycolicibacterium sp. F2034L]|uniref:LpqN/LpqT family lipoprotein n=1 Tax=Mycolicibacterium sp. F2034L TaxID=2926422 RepID=UPI001FF26ABE|nr:LpqN/LpqT family lipoprotein [Mycolicibacterium sp. F2034L]MCK0176772.1 LpqN/LpqT family lipoprotein [Mycolicibacterium sp. F2034L]
MKATALTGAAAAAAALAIVLSGCGSSSDSAESSPASSESTESSEASADTSAAETPAADEAEAPAPGSTVADYLNENEIAQVAVQPGQDGAPQIDLPTPPGWSTKNEGLPEGAYGGIAYTEPDAAPDFPPTIFAYLSRLDGPADPAAILGAAPNEVLALEGFQGDPGAAEKLSGFDAFEIAGQYMQDGKPTFVAQKTVVLPGPDALYMLQLNAYSKPEQQDKLGAAMGQIDTKTQITF